MKTCEIEGCDKPYRAKGLCSTHYNQQHQPDRHRKSAIVCVVCGTEWMSARKDGKYCSDACRAEDYASRGISPPSGSAHTRMALARRRATHAAKGKRGVGRWVAGCCAYCGAPFVSRQHGLLGSGKYCSETCRNRARRARHRGRGRGASGTSYSRYGIFRRDGWRCHICRRKTLPTKAVPHARAPTIDHLIPLADGGEDTAENVATACFMCNSTKREVGGNEQLALIGIA